MGKITYFGTDGKAGHYTKGIDYIPTDKEKDYYNHCDCESFFEQEREHYDESIKASYMMSIHTPMTIYSISYSIDDDRVGSHTVLFCEGLLSLEKMENIIIENNFLCHQFDMKNRGRIK